MTRVLWVVQGPIFEDGLISRSAGSGGWTAAMLDQLRQRGGLEIGVLSTRGSCRLSTETVEGLTHFSAQSKPSDGFDIPDDVLREVIAGFAPDIVHLEGAEFTIGATLARHWNGPTLVLLQGLLSGIEPHEYGGIARDLAWPPSLRNLLLLAAIAWRKRTLFAPRLRAERETLRRFKTFTGRTIWDRAHLDAINPGAEYHACQHILRAPFYEEAATGAEPRTIFIGSAANPRKGAHVAIRALALLKRRYPDVRLVVGGPAPSAQRNLKSAIGYLAYCDRLIDRMGVRGNVEFTGLLSADAMADRMRRAAVFLLPSMIENSPVTLSEAMRLGRPCVVADAGGTLQMARDEQEALFFRAGDAEVAAFQIHRLFEDPALGERLGANARKRATALHDPRELADTLAGIYQAMLAQ
jgi:glycosyltransferase involved in cell wall biosynthesis